MLDERPIQPDRKYLEEYIEKLSKIEQKHFLKRQSHPVLPCYQHSRSNEEVEEKKYGYRGSKAALYEDIKRKNKEKFGEKQMAEGKEEVAKKIDPKKMTVSYKPKHAKTIIDTEPYKEQKTKQASSSLHKSRKAKDQVEYDKLLEYFKKELN
jgi:hypothetical protein